MATKPKGLPKTGGRKKGSVNKVTANMRETIDTFLSENFDDMKLQFEMLEPRDKINAYIRLLEFTVPKLNRTQNEITGANGGPIQTTVIKFIDDSTDADNIG
jgi:hypothetical protein